MNKIEQVTILKQKEEELIEIHKKMAVLDFTKKLVDEFPNEIALKIYNFYKAYSKK